MFSPSLKTVLNLVLEQATAQKHDIMTVEHLLFALIDDEIIMEILSAFGADLQSLRTQLEVFICEFVPRAEIGKNLPIQPSSAFQRVLERAVSQVQATGDTEVNKVDLFTSILAEEDKQIVHFLQAGNIKRKEIINYIAQDKLRTHPYRSQFHGRSQAQTRAASASVAVGDGLSQEEASIASYAVNLNEQAKLGKISAVIRREKQIARTIQVLCRMKKNNPLLVGEPGVGKTAIAEGIAKLLVEKKVPAPIAHSTLYSLSLGCLVAGTKYRGDFEKRMESAIAVFKKMPGTIVFIDEVHTLIGAGASGGTLDAANLLKPLLSTGQLRFIGATTYEEYRKIFEKDTALSRRFQKIDILEPSVDETYAILQELKTQLENHHGVKYTQAALKGAASLSDRYISDRRLPDKAIDVLDEVGAYVNLRSEGQDKPKLIGICDIERMIAQMARIPVANISLSDKKLLKDLDKRLKMVIFGQNAAIDSLVGAIRSARAGLRETKKPIGSFLFTGPTGVGKTELARQLAQLLGVKLLRFDMSEYMEHHSASRLIGAPPGYVGYDQAGLLTESVIKHPYCVLLLDEIEKAHPDIFNLLLQVMDCAQLTDRTGRTASFKHVVCIMTTNAGSKESHAPMGFTKAPIQSACDLVVAQFFSPEFLNRLDGIISFNHLDHATLCKVAEKLLTEIQKRLRSRHVHITFDQKTPIFLAKQSVTSRMGARPISRLLHEKIQQPLADAILFGKIKSGGSVHVSIKKDDISLDM